MYSPEVTIEQVLELWEQGGIGKQEAYNKLAKEQVEADFQLAKDEPELAKELGLDLFEIIEYALFRMKK